MGIGKKQGENMRDIEELKKAPGLSLKRYLILFISNVMGVYLISSYLSSQLSI